MFGICSVCRANSLPSRQTDTRGITVYWRVPFKSTSKRNTRTNTLRGEYRRQPATKPLARAQASPLRGIYSSGRNRPRALGRRALESCPTHSRMPQLAKYPAKRERNSARVDEQAYVRKEIPYGVEQQHFSISTLVRTRKLFVARQQSSHYETRTARNP